MARMDDTEKGGESAPLMSASAYSASKKAAMKAAKSQKVPVGGAPPLDKGKMRQLAQGLGAAKEAMSPKRFPELPPQDPDNPHDNPISRASMFGDEEGKPMSLSRAKKAVMEAASPQEEVEEPKAPYRPLSPEAREALETEPADLDEEDARAQRQEAAEERVAAGVSKLESLDFSPEEMGIVRNQLLDPKRKELVESRLQPINFGDLVMQGDVVQEIPIRDDFRIELRTMKEYENLYVVQKLYGVAGSNAYVQEMIGLYRATCSLVSINGNVLPDHRVHIGDMLQEDVDEKKFEHKLKIMKRLALPILIEIGIQYDWLVERVNKLLSIEALKNG